MAKPPEYVPDPLDGLRAMKVGLWAKEKHDLLSKYIDGTRFMRRGWKHRIYIELFSGPGRVWYRHHGPFADGSALRAWRASQRDGAAFTRVFINDLDPENLSACQRRLEGAGAPVTALNMEAEKAAPLILQQLPRRDAVHLSLLDPFAIGVLPFSMVRTFASHEKMDIVVNYGVHDVQRNLLKNLRGEADEMDRFCPGWREELQGVTGKRAQRGRVLERWLRMVKATGAEYSKDMPLIRHTHRRVPLYHLVFAAHHEGPIRVWGDVARSGQGDLPF